MEVDAYGNIIDIGLHNQPLRSLSLSRRTVDLQGRFVMPVSYSSMVHKLSRIPYSY